ncbi:MULTISPECIES: chloride channel protein [Listeria]|uniref:chloride channel protein n=1 Tax=Listeria TaxID=1637 RepID=UPI000B595446|nr:MULTISPECIES: chloride channel protein [Listeria]
MKKLSFIYICYTLLIGAFVGLVGALFIALIEFSIHIVWQEIPSLMPNLSFYPVLVGLVGGLLVGLIQTKVGPFPYTLHENMAEVKKTGRVEYKNRLLYTILAAWVVLSFGASLGPEAALVGIIGGLVTWLVDHIKMDMQRKESLINLGILGMLSVVFLAPLNGIAEDLDQDYQEQKLPRWSKLCLSLLVSVSGLVTYIFVKGLLPLEKSVFAIRLPEISWSWLNLVYFIPIIILGSLFGIYFLFLQNVVQKVLKLIKNKILLALIGGVSIGLFGMISHYFLFSGEHQLVEITAEIAQYPFWLLLAIGLFKPLLTAICLGAGWKGGMIFPAIFASGVMGYVATWALDIHVSFLVTVFVAASCTKVVGRPFLTSSILLFVFPLQFFPFILITAFLVSLDWKKMVLRQA